MTPYAPHMLNLFCTLQFVLQPTRAIRLSRASEVPYLPVHALVCRRHKMSECTHWPGDLTDRHESPPIGYLCALTLIEMHESPPEPEQSDCGLVTRLMAEDSNP